MSPVERILSRLMPIPECGCMVYEGATPAKYGMLWVNGKSRRAHRALWELVNGEIPKGMLILHKCGVPSCCNLNHLYLGTPKQNMLDRTYGNEYVKRITAEVAYEIKRKLKEGFTPTQLAKEYKTSRQSISDMKFGRIWKFDKEEKYVWRD